MLSHFSHVWLSAMLWTVAHQAPLSMGLSRQEYWTGLPSSRGSAYSGIEPTSLVSSGLAGGFSTTSTTWKAPTSNKFPQFLFAWESLYPSLLKDTEFWSIGFFSLSTFKIFHSTFFLHDFWGDFFIYSYPCSLIDKVVFFFLPEDFLDIFYLWLCALWKWYA